MSAAFDLIVLGSGFSGSLLSMVARRQGLSVLLLERGAHPRFAIGESTSPLTNLLLDELALRYDLPRLKPLTEWGSWQRTYPDLPVGLKRGFTYYHHEAGQPFAPDPERERQLLVAASPYDAVGDTHWYRAAFDEFLLREARELGVEYLDRIKVTGLSRDAETTAVTGTRHGRSVEYRARFLVDATGQRGALSRLFQIPEEPFNRFPATQGLFSHFTGVRLFADLADAGGETPPYAPDDAALHHVFEGGWMWVLRFNNGITSAGFAVEDWLAEELRLDESESAWDRFLQRFPSIGEQFAGSERVLPWVHSRRVPYRAAQMHGPGWVMLPSAASFVDPLFSTGFPLTLLGIHRLGKLLAKDWGTERFQDGLDPYAQTTWREAESSALLVAGCYGAFGRFPDFATLSMLYFVAASYSEMARRLGRADLASEFLLQNRPAFRESFRRHCSAAREGAPVPFDALAAEVEPFNIAGLCDPSKRNCYGVDLGDVIRGASKLEQTDDGVREFIRRMGW